MEILVDQELPGAWLLLVNLPSEKFSKDARDFTAQLRKHYGWIPEQPAVQADHSLFEPYLTGRVLRGRGGRWIDRLELNVVSRASEVPVLGVPSEGRVSLNARKALSLKGFAKHNAEYLMRRGLAQRQADNAIVPMGFVTQRMFEAYEREKKFFFAHRGGYCKHGSSSASC